METKATLRYVSGREEQFEIELIGGSTAESRLKDFASNPTIVLRTDEELIIIPSTAIENIRISYPEYGAEELDFSGVRRARRLA
jgi:hypothetical protein